MRKLILGVFTAILLASCSKKDSSDDNVSETYPQKWTLIEMSGQMTNSTTTGKNMDWQEEYLLNADGTFLKNREQDGVIKAASGTFLFNNQAD